MLTYLKQMMGIIVHSKNHNAKFTEIKRSNQIRRKIKREKEMWLQWCSMQSCPEVHINVRHCIKITTKIEMGTRHQRIIPQEQANWEDKMLEDVPI